MRRCYWHGAIWIFGGEFIVREDAIFGASFMQADKIGIYNYQRYI